MMEVRNNAAISFYEPTKEFININSKDKILIDCDLFKQISLTKKDEPVAMN